MLPSLLLWNKVSCGIKISLLHSVKVNLHGQAQSRQKMDIAMKIYGTHKLELGYTWLKDLMFAVIWWSKTNDMKVKLLLQYNKCVLTRNIPVFLFQVVFRSYLWRKNIGLKIKYMKLTTRLSCWREFPVKNVSFCQDIIFVVSQKNLLPTWGGYCLHFFWNNTIGNFSLPQQ